MNLYTSCQNCFFAIYDDKKEQVGCSQDMLTKIAEKTNKQIDFFSDEKANKSYNIIRNFVCPTYRPVEWGEKQAYPESRLMEEMKLKWQAMVVIDKDFTAINGEEESAEYIKNILYQLDSSFSPPSFVNIIYQKDNFVKPEIIFNKLSEKEYKFQWTLQVCKEDADLWNQVDTAFDKHKQDRCLFYTVFNNIPYIRNHFIEVRNHYFDIHNLIFEELAEVAMIEHDYGDTYFSIFHRNLNGNAVDGLLKDKIKFLNKPQEVKDEKGNSSNTTTS